MKCKACDGKGTYITIGIDKEEFVDKEEKCPVCNGTGEIEQTNEEWFCGLPTEEKARFLAGNKMLLYDYQMWIEWLKEVHRG